MVSYGLSRIEESKLQYIHAKKTPHGLDLPSSIVKRRGYETGVECCMEKVLLILSLWAPSVIYPGISGYHFNTSGHEKTIPVVSDWYYQTGGSVLLPQNKTNRRHADRDWLSVLQASAARACNGLPDNSFLKVAGRLDCAGHPPDLKRYFSRLNSLHQALKRLLSPLLCSLRACSCALCFVLFVETLLQHNPQQAHAVEPSIALPLSQPRFSRIQFVNSSCVLARR